MCMLFLLIKNFQFQYCDLKIDFTNFQLALAGDARIQISELKQICSLLSYSMAIVLEPLNFSTF